MCAVSCCLILHAFRCTCPLSDSVNCQMPNCGGTQQITVAEFLGATSSFEFKDQLIVSMSIPFTAAGEKLVTFRQVFLTLK